MNVSSVCSNYSKIVSKVCDGMPKKKLKAVDKSNILQKSTEAIALSSAAMVKKPITVSEIQKNLLKIGFLPNENGHYEKELTKDEYKNLRNAMGNIINDYLKFYDRPLQPVTIEKFKEFVNLGGGKGHELFNKNFEETLMTFLTLGYNGRLASFTEKCNKNKNLFTLIENVVNSNPKNNLETIKKYKMNPEINFSLRFKHAKNDYKIPRDKLEVIEKLSSYIDSQPIKNPIKLFRGEGFSGLSQVKMENGKVIDLGKVLSEAQKSKDDNKINKIREFILDHELTAIQPGFMSTSLEKSKSCCFAIKEDKGYCLNLITTPNTKGTYVEAANVTGYYANENEVLLQKGSKIKIQDAKFDKKHNIWNIYGTVSN